jgi:translation elongation factor EF-G
MRAERAFAGFPLPLDGIQSCVLHHHDHNGRSQHTRKRIRKAGPILLKPVMRVETVTPGDYLGDVIGDINRRRGSIQDQLERGTNIAVVANVPLSEMFGYIGQLRSMTSETHTGNALTLCNTALPSMA